MPKSKIKISCDIRTAAYGIALFIILPFWGCVTPPKPTTVPPPAESPHVLRQRETVDHLLGEWTTSTKSGKTTHMIFSPGGQLAFQGGLEYYNPGQWTVDASRQELVIRLPQADVDKLPIFKLYVGQGIQSFNPSQKEIVYRFDMQTWSFNFAGWEFSKVDKTKTESLAEPTFK